MSTQRNSPVSSDDMPADNAHTPRPLTLSENIVLTLKVLGGLGALGAALWGVNVWKAAQ